MNADASKWGDLLIGGDYHFAAHFNSPGSWNADGQLRSGGGGSSPGGSSPTAATIVTAMSDDLLTTVFLKKGEDAPLCIESLNLSVPLLTLRDELFEKTGFFGVFPMFVPSLSW